MDLNTVTIADFKGRFYRDFFFNQSDTGNAVQDRDITSAFAEAQSLLNQALFGGDATIKQAYLYLTAHCLSLAIRDAGGGINGQASFPMAGRSVGSVSATYGIPESYLKSPILAMYTQTAYGLRYLNLALPGMTGNMVAVYGGTNP